MATDRDFSALRRQAAFVPTCAVALAVALLASCGDPYAEWALRPAGFSGQTQLWEERATGCIYASDGKGKFSPRPMLRPDGSQMGCKPNTPGEA